MKHEISTRTLRIGQKSIQGQVTEQILLDLQGALLTLGSHQLLLSSPQERSLLYQTINYVGRFKPTAYFSMYDHPDLHVVPNLYNPRSSIETILASLEEMEIVCVDLCSVTHDFMDKVAIVHELLSAQVQQCSYVTIEYVH